MHEVELLYSLTVTVNAVTVPVQAAPKPVCHIISLIRYHSQLYYTYRNITALLHYLNLLPVLLQAVVVKQAERRGPTQGGYGSLEIDVPFASAVSTRL